jgi:hypothetical protein
LDLKQSAQAAKLEALGFAWEMSAAAISKRVSKGSRDRMPAVRRS